MEPNIELLNFIYQNAEMGVITIKELIEICEDAPFRALLTKELEGYEKFHREAEAHIRRSGKEPKDIAKTQELSTYFMLKVNTIRHRTPSHFAEMMIQGSSMGTIDLCKKLNSYKEQVEKESRQLAEDLLKFEEANIEELKGFLRSE